MTAWFFLTAYYYAIVAGPFVSQGQCEEMRAYAEKLVGSWHPPSRCYEAPIAPLASPGPAIDRRCSKACDQ